LIDRPLKVAIPPLAVSVLLPVKVPEPGLVPIARVTSVKLSVVTRFPFASSIRTVTAGEMDAPATVLEGCCKNVSFEAKPAVPVAVKVNGEPVRVPLVAVKVFDPAVVPNVQLSTVAIPLALVVTEPTPDTDPPPEATANVTLTPLTGLLLASFTITLGNIATAVPTVAV
jgi:hypothetical protein